jgi:CubicO group peptidase (beta-lactamase class C family)
MTADHLPADIKVDPDTAALFGPLLPTAEFGAGFGLGFAIRTMTGRSYWHGSEGDYDWVGYSGCMFWNDPREQLFAILMMQAPTQLISYFYLMRAMVYQALID